MRDREPFDLYLPLNIWNALLAAFSIAGTMTLLPEFVHTVRSKGFKGILLILLIIIWSLQQYFIF